MRKDARKVELVKSLLAKYNGKVTNSAIVRYLRAEERLAVSPDTVKAIRAKSGFKTRATGRAPMDYVQVISKGAIRVIASQPKPVNPLDIIAVNVAKACKHLNVSSIMFKVEGDTVIYAATQHIQGEVHL